jgi:23S rRNA pseudouridine2605 synthase
MSRVPLERALSKLGLASRTQARRLIESGKVKVHGKLQTDPLFLVTPETAAISIQGEAIAKQSQVVFAFYKPRGVITSRSDEKGRTTIFDLLPDELKNNPALHSVGRLDLATTGLLLLTNDTRLSAWLTDPKNRISRVYQVSVQGEVSQAQKLEMESGIESEVGKLQALSVTLRKTSQRESHLLIELTEGKNREIRRLCEAIGHPVSALKRTSFGPLHLGDLQPGEWREISPTELKRAFPHHPESTTLKTRAPKSDPDS